MNTELFEIIENPIKNATTDEIIPGKKALFVNDHCVNIVSSERYKVIQPKRIYDQFKEKSNLKITKVITNPNHGSILLGARYDNLVIDGEEHAFDLTFYTGHNNYYSTFLTLDTLRIACMNQLSGLIGRSERHILKCKHIHSFDFDKLEEIIETLPLHIQNFNAQCVRMKESKLSKKDFIESFVEFFKLQDVASKDKKVAAIKSIYEGATGQDVIEDDTAYKAFHAVTYDLTHHVKKSKNQLEKVNIQNQKTVHQFYNFMDKQGLLVAA